MGTILCSGRNIKASHVGALYLLHFTEPNPSRYFHTFFYRFFFCHHLNKCAQLIQSISLLSASTYVISQSSPFRNFNSKHFH